MFFYIVDQGFGERAFLSNLPQDEFAHTVVGKVVGRVVVPEGDQQFFAMMARDPRDGERVERLVMAAWQMGRHHERGVRGHDHI